MTRTFLVGIFFDALVSGGVAIAAFMFMVFLFRRWSRLDTARRAYAWFWFFTMLVWITISIRYFVISIGYMGLGVYIGDIIVEGSIYFCGPPLFYYLSLRVFKQQWVANCLAIFSTAMAFTALCFVVLPHGMSEVHMTDFSADVSINSISLGIFASQILIIIGFILYDIIKYLYKWWKGNDDNKLYKFLYSLPLLIYVLLGAIDQSKIILDWPLIVFRVLYASAFLFAYLIIVEEETQNEQYLVEQKNP